jgi:xanthine dehydrogenase accessory factor
MLDFKRISQLQKESGIIAVATVVRVHGSAPRETGSKMAILPSGRTEGTVGGGKLEKLVIEDALSLMGVAKAPAVEGGKGFAYREYRLTSEDEQGIGTECGGNVDVFIEVTGSPDHLVILGGGHIGLALYKMARVSDFRVTVVDDREEFSRQERFPEAQVVLSKYDDESIQELITPESFVVILTHGHMHDAAALRNVIGTGAQYIGMIGSRRKIGKVREQLVEENVSEEALDAVFTPVGLDIGAETPAEIAVAVLAEIINVKKKGTPSSIGMGRKDQS